MIAFTNFLLALLPLSVSAASISQRETFSRRDSPIPPSQDPFYAAPSGFQSQKPGTILKSRVVPSGLAGLSNAKTGYQLLFRSTDDLGNPAVAITTVIVPNTGNSSRVVSYQIPYDSADEDCGPSYSLQNGAPSTTASLTGDSTFINDLLGDGYYVNTPDYEGPTGAFTAGQQSGQATLDSVRAALKSQSITGVSPNAVYTMWGYSGGALASEWAAELQSIYAPELKFLGVALGGLTPNVSSVVYATNKGPFAGLIPAGIIGQSRANPKLQKFLKNQLIPSTAAKFMAAGSQCLSTDVIQFFNNDIGTYFKNGIATLSSAPSLKAINRSGVMGLHGTPQMPLYVYKAVGDEVSPVADTDSLVSKYCAAGTAIEYIRTLVGGHITEAASGASGAMSFLADRFNGVAFQTACTTQTS